MQVISKFRRLVSVVVAVAAISLVASCVSSKSQKYGCPNHLQVLSTILR
jgi:hypothetical protein